jgi:hypothetical protein
MNTIRKNNMLYRNEKNSTEPIGAYINNKCYNTLTSKLLLEYRDGNNDSYSLYRKRNGEFFLFKTEGYLNGTYGAYDCHFEYDIIPLSYNETCLELEEIDTLESKKVKNEYFKNYISTPYDMKTKLSDEQKNQLRYLDFLYDESQIYFQEYKEKLIELVGIENVRESKVLLGYGQIENVIEIK